MLPVHMPTMETLHTLACFLQPSCSATRPYQPPCSKRVLALPYAMSYPRLLPTLRSLYGCQTPPVVGLDDALSCPAYVGMLATMENRTRNPIGLGADIAVLQLPDLKIKMDVLSGELAVALANQLCRSYI